MSSYTDERNECLSILQDAASPPTAQVGSEIASRVEGTCEWVLNHHKYIEWRSDNSPQSFLWLTADPGSGKSVIANFLVEKLSNELHTSRTIVCRFFFKKGQLGLSNAVQTLSTLLSQVVLGVEDQSLVGAVVARFKSLGPGFTNVETLWGLLTSATTLCSGLEVICIIDALDECEEQSRALLIEQFVHTFSKTATISETEAEKPHTNGRFRVLVTSRPYVEIEERFPANMLRLRGEEERRAISGDIKLLIDSRTKALQRRCRLNVAECITIKLALEAKAGHTFLWVSIVLGLIENSVTSTYESILETIHSVPSQLQDTYEYALKGIGENHDAVAILAIMLAANRPLTVHEMSVALRCNGNSPTFKADDFSLHNFEVAFKLINRFFVQLIHSKLHFIHQTAREFLLDHPSLLGGRVATSTFDLMLAERCINYLMIPQWKIEELINGNGADDSTEHRILAFYEYSATNWFLHIETLGTTFKLPALLKHKINILCNPNDERFRKWSSHYFYPDTKDEIGLIISRGNYRLFEGLYTGGFFGQKQWIRAQQRNGWYYAFTKSQADTIIWMFQTFPEIGLNKSLALCLAAEKGQEYLVRRLLGLGFDVNQGAQKSTGHEVSPLNAACLSKSPNSYCVVKLLLEAGANVNTVTVNIETGHFYTALGDAIFTENHKAVEILVKHGALILHAAVINAVIRRASKQAIRIFLEQSTSCNVSQRNAALKSMIDAWKDNGTRRIGPIIQILKDGNIALDPNWDGTEWLEYATAYLPIDNVDILISLGATDSLSTCLDVALSRRLIVVFRRLLQIQSYSKEHLNTAIARVLKSHVNPQVELNKWQSSCEKSLNRNSTLVEKRRLRYLRESAINDCPSLEMTWKFVDALLNEDASVSMHDFYRILSDSLAHDEVYAYKVYATRKLLTRLPDFDCFQFLSVACYRGNHWIVQEMLSLGAPVNNGDIYGITPLVAAIMGNNALLVIKLLENGANPNQRSHYSFFHSEARFHPQLYSHIDEDFREWAVRDQAWYSKKVYIPGSPLSWAMQVLSSTSSTHLVTSLLIFGARPWIHLSDALKYPDESWSAMPYIHVAASGFLYDVIDDFIQYDPSDINVLDTHGRTALHCAALDLDTAADTNTAMRVTSLLVMQGIDISALDEDHKTALDLVRDGKEISELEPGSTRGQVARYLADVAARGSNQMDMEEIQKFYENCQTSPMETDAPARPGGISSRRKSDASSHDSWFQDSDAEEMDFGQSDGSDDDEQGEN